MKVSKITQKQMAFYKLYQWLHEKKGIYVATWEFVGEIYIKELKEWVMMSYKCPARLSDIFNENPGLLDRKLIKGKSGSEYFGYKFNTDVTDAHIKDPILREFYKLIRK